jgi:hypothetical protein
MSSLPRFLSLPAATLPHPAAAHRAPTSPGPVCQPHARRVTRAPPAAELSPPPTTAPRPPSLFTIFPSTWRRTPDPLPLSSPPTPPSCHKRCRSPSHSPFHLAPSHLHSSTPPPPPSFLESAHWPQTLGPSFSSPISPETPLSSARSVSR